MEQGPSDGPPMVVDSSKTNSVQPQTSLSPAESYYSTEISSQVSPQVRGVETAVDIVVPYLTPSPQGSAVFKPPQQTEENTYPSASVVFPNLNFHLISPPEPAPTPAQSPGTKTPMETAATDLLLEQLFHTNLTAMNLTSMTADKTASPQSSASQNAVSPLSPPLKEPDSAVAILDVADYVETKRTTCNSTRESSTFGVESVNPSGQILERPIQNVVSGAPLVIETAPPAVISPAVISSAVISSAVIPPAVIPPAVIPPTAIPPAVVPPAAVIPSTVIPPAAVIPPAISTPFAVDTSKPTSQDLLTLFDEGMATVAEAATVTTVAGVATVAELPVPETAGATRAINAVESSDSMRPIDEVGTNQSQSAALDRQESVDGILSAFPPTEAVDLQIPPSEKVVSSPKVLEKAAAAEAADKSRPKLTLATVASILFPAQIDSRPAASVEAKELENAERKNIYVIYGNTCTPISWYTDMASDDVRQLILCGCDAIIDGGFVLRRIHDVVTLPSPPQQQQQQQLLLDSAFSSGTTANSPQGAEMTPGVTFPLGTNSPLGAKAKSTMADAPDEDDDDDLETDVSIGDYTIRVRKGRRYEFEEFHKLRSNEFYLLEAATERSDLKPIIGDRLRRLKVRIHPLIHVEAQKAIAIMKRGANLLRHNSGRLPHVRQFQLSADSKRLLIYATDDDMSTILPLAAVKELCVGQVTPLFKKYRLPALAHLSFSLIYDSTQIKSNMFHKVLDFIEGQHTAIPESLDLTCKDVDEYDAWITGFKALICLENQMTISKKELLGHSQRFKDVLTKLSSTALQPKPSDSSSTTTPLDFDACLTLPQHSLDEIEKKLCRLVRVLETLEERSAAFDEEFGMSIAEVAARIAEREEKALCVPAEIESSGNFEKTNDGILRPASVVAQPVDEEINDSGDAPGAAFFSSLTEEEDDLLEYRRQKELLISVKERLTATQATLQALDATYSDEAKEKMLSRINQDLWKSEVDAENVEDMIKRLKTRRSGSPLGAMRSEAFQQKLSQVNQHISTEVSKMSSAVNRFFGSFRQQSPYSSPRRS